MSRAPRHEQWLSSTEACARLGVKRATLYSYVSRGTIRCAGEGRTRKYAADDVDRVATRSEARRGHAAVAVGALRWGEPVLDTSITSVGADGFTYRGRAVAALARERVVFEAVADLLWAAPDGERWPEGEPRAPKVERGLSTLERYVDVVTSVGRAEGGGIWPDETGERARARRLIRAMGAVTGDGASGSGRIAEVLASRLGVAAERAWVFDVALVLCADHELNVSSFTARVAASAGADLHGCVGAALQVFKGALHGGAPERLEGVLEGLRDGDMEQALRERLERGDELPGFGHTLYPEGDPRVRPMLEAAEAVGAKGARWGRARAYVEAGERVTGAAPTVDAALVMACAALELPRGMASALFALGRTAGWVAHALEQRRAGVLLRPRARYVGELGSRGRRDEES